MTSKGVLHFEIFDREPKERSVRKAHGALFLFWFHYINGAGGIPDHGPLLRKEGG